MSDVPTMAQPPEALIWGVKTSFRRYLRTAGGTVTVIDPAAEDGFFFVFPFADGADSTDSGSDDLRFTGSVHFAAHFGALDFSLSEPAIIRYRGASWLTVAATEAAADVSRLTIALLTDGPGTPSVHDTETAGQVELWPVLTAEGSHLFGDVYPPETMLDPLYLPHSLVDRITR